MKKVEQLSTGKIALIRQEVDGRIVQIGLNKDQSDQLQIFLAAMSREKTFVQLGSEYDLMLAILSA